MPRQGNSTAEAGGRAFPPPAANPAQAEVGIGRWRELAGRAEGERRDDLMALAEGESRPLLDAVFGNSPFLSGAALADPDAVLAYVRSGPERAVEETLAAMRETGSIADTDKSLRRARRRIALVTALADLSGDWPLDRITGTLSRFADAAIGAALDAHLLDAARRGHVDAGPDGGPPRDGFIVLGMGKLGGRELNYSSDIDLIVFYDPDAIATGEPDRLRERVVRLIRGMVGSLQQRTAEGYVFRVDLRLRPDPASTPVAVSLPAAMTYYESMGQNWERAAMIRARPVAGDIAAGEAVLQELRPFVWRRSLDFATIQDVHSIKRQIYAHKGGEAVAVEGHNIKLGRGGIREIEFFAQTQQLIFGGRDPRLRSANTIAALQALLAAGLIDAGCVDDLSAAYDFLRTVEHRLQMINDQQTHSIPEDADGVRRLACFMGYADVPAFREALLGHLRKVEDHYVALFEEEAPLSGGPGNLVFTGGEHDPGTLATLERLGFQKPETVSARIRAWHHGRYRATHSNRARQLLTELVPTLLEALADTAHPDEAFTRFDGFLAGLPAGVQLFSLFHAHPELLKIVAEIMGTAPRLAAHLSRRPVLLDLVLTRDFFGDLPDRQALAESLESAFGQARDYEEVLDAARRWAGDYQFQVGAQFLRGSIDAVGAGAAQSDIADVAIGGLLPHVEAEFAEAHGRIAGGRFCVLGLGKLGGRELSATSDLDLVFVYDFDHETKESDGARPLSPSHYYARFAQRLFNALTAQTAEGKLYEVDMRLRPAGSKGPLASSLSAFVAYQREEAWTWEHMALTRARFVAGDAGLGQAVMDVVRETLVRARDADKLVVEVASMRARIAREHKAPSIWSVKHVRGGIVDVEFIAQYLELRHAAAHPDVLSTNTAAAFERLAASDCLAPEPAARLAAAARLWQQVQAMLRLTVGDTFDEEAAPAALKRTLARVAGLDNLSQLEARLTATAEEVRQAFEEIIAAPAAALSAGGEAAGTRQEENSDDG